MDKRRNKPYTLGEAAVELSERWNFPVTHQMVWYWVHTGKLKASRPPTGKGWWRVAVSDLDEFAERKT